MAESTPKHVRTNCTAGTEISFVRTRVYPKDTVNISRGDLYIVLSLIFIPLFRSFVTAAKTCLYLIKINFPALYLFVVSLCLYYWYFLSSWNQVSVSH